MRASFLCLTDRLFRGPCPVRANEREMNLQDEMGNLNKNPRSNVHPDRSTIPPHSSGFQDRSQGYSPDPSGRGIRPPKPPAPTLEKVLLSSTGESQGSTPWTTASDSGQDAYQHETMLGTDDEPEAMRHDPEPLRPCGLSEPPLAQSLRSTAGEVDDVHAEQPEADRWHHRPGVQSVASGGAGRSGDPRCPNGGEAARPLPGPARPVRSDPIGAASKDVVYDVTGSSAVAGAGARPKVDSRSAGQDQGSQRQANGAAAAWPPANSLVVRLDSSAVEQMTLAYVNLSRPPAVEADSSEALPPPKEYPEPAKRAKLEGAKPSPGEAFCPPLRLPPGLGLECPETLDETLESERACPPCLARPSSAPQMEGLVLPPAGSKDIKVRSRWHGLLGWWSYRHKPAERNITCPHALSKHERGCWCGTQRDGWYEWLFTPDHPPLDPLTSRQRYPASTRYAPGYPQIAKVLGWHPRLCAVPSDKGWSNLSNFVRALGGDKSAARPEDYDLESELGCCLTGACWLLAHHAALCESWLAAGKRELADRGLPYPMQAPPTESEAKASAKAAASRLGPDRRVGCLLAKWTHPSSIPGVGSPSDGAGVRFQPSASVMAKGTASALVWGEECMETSDEDSEEDSVGGYVPPTKAPDVRPCGPGEKGALVEMSTPSAMDRKGYPPGVVEGHQWERTTPPVTPERDGGGGGGGARAPADISR